MSASKIERLASLTAFYDKALKSATAPESPDGAQVNADEIRSIYHAGAKTFDASAFDDISTAAIQEAIGPVFRGHWIDLTPSARRFLLSHDPWLKAFISQ